MSQGVAFVAGSVRLETQTHAALGNASGRQEHRHGGEGATRALYEPGSLVLLLSPSLRQSQELFLKTISLYQSDLR